MMSDGYTSLGGCFLIKQGSPKGIGFEGDLGMGSPLGDTVQEGVTSRQLTIQVLPYRSRSFEPPHHARKPSKPRTGFGGHVEADKDIGRQSIVEKRWNAFNESRVLFGPEDPEDRRMRDIRQNLQFETNAR